MILVNKLCEYCYHLYDSQGPLLIMLDYWVIHVFTEQVHKFKKAFFKHLGAELTQRLEHMQEMSRAGTSIHKATFKESQLGK